MPLLRSLAILALSATVMVTAVGCSKEEPAAKSPHGDIASGAPKYEPAPAIAIKIGVPATADALPLWIAQEQGVFTAQGIPSSEVVLYETQDELLAAFVAGDVDAALVGLVDAAKLEDGKRPVTLVTVASDPALSSIPTVLVVADDYLLTLGGSETVDAVDEAWDKAVGIISDDKTAAKKVLSEKAPGDKMPSAFPLHQLPSNEESDAAIEQAGLTGTVTYESLLLVLPS